MSRATGSKPIIFLLTGLLLAALALTNPDEEAFARSYADRLNAELAAELGLQGALGELLGGVTQRALEAALVDQVERRNYVVASIFTLRTASEDLQALGLLGRFVTLSGPNGRPAP